MQQHQDYLRHQKGLTLLWLWMDQWRGLDGWTFDNSELCLSYLCSQRFSLGAPKSKRGVRGRLVFIGVQPQEASWLKRIPWSKVIADASSERLWLVSQSRESPDKAWPDLPPVAIGIRINKEHFDGWNDHKIEWRNVWWDDDNISHVDTAPSGSLSFVRGTLEDKWSANARASLKSLRDIVMENLEETSVPLDPGFKGSLGDLTDQQQEYLKPFEKKKEHFIEEEYPEIFGQFFEEEPKSKKQK